MGYHDDVYFSFFENRLLRRRLFDPENPEHMAGAKAYLAKANSNDPSFTSWTAQSEKGKTWCPVKGESANDPDKCPNRPELDSRRGRGFALWRDDSE